ncbi:hypothetical protein N9Q18_00400 [bacterium]|nr:hypothetical protein [bacterium]
MPDTICEASTANAPITATPEATQAALHEVATFSWSALVTVDPDTLLPTGGVVGDFAAEARPSSWDNELLAPAYNKFTDLARSTTLVAMLYDATDGDLERAPIYTNLYSQLGGGRRAPCCLRGQLPMLGCRESAPFSR